MTTIYLVSAGSYSDYHVVSLFSEKGKAEQLASQENGNVEEYLLDDPKWQNQLIKQQTTDKGWSCSLEFIGEGRAKNYPNLSRENFRISQYELSYCLEMGDLVDFKDYSDFDDQDYWTGSWDMHTHVIAETEDVASKIAMERFQGFIAKRALDGKPLERGKA